MLRSTRKPDIELTKDERLILRGLAYHKMRVELSKLANEKCEKCGVHCPLEKGEAHHPAGRGGGRRNDRIFIGRKRNLFWYCAGGWGCHNKHHIPDKVVPAKPTDQQFKELLGL